MNIKNAVKCFGFSMSIGLVYAGIAEVMQFPLSPVVGFVIGVGSTLYALNRWG